MGKLLLILLSAAACLISSKALDDGSNAPWGEDFSPDIVSPGNLDDYRVYYDQRDDLRGDGDYDIPYNNEDTNTAPENYQREANQIRDDQIENDQMWEDQMEDNQIDNDQMDHDQIDNDQMEDEEMGDDQREDDYAAARDFDVKDKYNIVDDTEDEDNVERVDENVVESTYEHVSNITNANVTGSNTVFVRNGSELENNEISQDVDASDDNRSVKRNKRQTTVNGSATRDRYGRTNVDVSGSRKWGRNRATVYGNVNRGPYGRGHSVGGSYGRTWNNGRTSLGVSGSHSRFNGRRNNQFGVSFSHRFRRSADNVRNKRQTTIGGSATRDRYGTTNVDVSGSRKWGRNRATVYGNVNRGPYGRGHSVGGSYGRTWNNGRTSLGVSGSHSRFNGRRNNQFGVSFSHRFRGRRSADNVRNKRQTSIDASATRDSDGTTNVDVSGSRTWGNGRNTASVNGNLNNGPFGRGSGLSGSYSRNFNDGRTSFGVHGGQSQFNGYRSNNAGVSASHKWGNGNSLFLSGDRSRGQFHKSQSVSSGYRKSWNNGRTSFDVGGTHSRTNGRPSNSFGLSFTHRFKG